MHIGPGTVSPEFLENRVSGRVVITFDDGYLNFHSEAFPVLSLFGFSATVFLPTGFIDDRAMAFKGKIA